jgi:hypothetical protein
VPKKLEENHPPKRLFLWESRSAKEMAKKKQQTEKKKRGLCRRIFKWIGLGLLSLLIIAATFLHAPWKVITLLLIILAACSALPKPARKWFWLSAAAVVIASIIWVFLPDDTEGWRPYTFDEELAALEAKYAAPDEENAAMIYNKLFEDFDIDSNQPEFFLVLSPSSINEPWLSKDHPETAEWLKTQQSTIETLMQASKIEECRFSIPSDHFTFGESMKRLAPMRQCAFLLVSAANNDIAEGRIQQALEKNLTILQMAKHQCQQPTIIDMLVGIAVESLATNQFNRFVVTGDATEERLSVIEKAVADVKHDWSSDLPRVLECEKLMAKNLWAFFYEVNSEGRTRFRRDPTAAMREQFPEDMPLLNYWQKKLIRAHTILIWFYFPSNPQKAAKIIDAAYEKYYAMAKPNFDWKKGPKELSPRFRLNYQYLIEHMANMLEAPYYRIHDLYLRAIATQRGSQLIIALRRYKNKTGRWPENLDDIETTSPAEIFVDTINGDSFVYKLTEENFALYSKGKNNIDEGGKDKRGRDDWLIWPLKSRKTKEENADAEQQ